MKELNRIISDLNKHITEIKKRSFDDGFEAARTRYATEEFSPARTENLSKTVIRLQSELKYHKKRLSLATKLLRYAQSTECGKNGQFDRFFEEGYDEIDE